MENGQTALSRREDGRSKAITALIESVTEEQEALARILEAEHQKIEKAIDLCGTDVEDLVRIDRSVERVLAAVTRLEVALQLKLDLFHGCLCQGESEAEEGRPCHQ